MRLTIYMAMAAFVLATSAAQGQGLIKRKAKEHEDKNHFVDASDSYQGLYERGSREASLQAARNLYKARRYEDALGLYEYADSLKIIADADEVFRYFECLKSVKRYADADRLVKSRISDFKDRPEFGLHDDRLDYYNKLTSFKGVELKQLGLNTRFSEISPTVYDGWLYFVSTRPATGNHKVHRINMQPFYNIYAVPLEGDMKQSVSPVGKFGMAEGKIRLNGKEGRSLPNDINEDYHDGPILVTPSGKFLFYTTNYSDQVRPKEKKGEVNLRIRYAVKQGEVWPAPVEFPSNSWDYTNQHAFYDEGSSTLYFSSNRPGGKGGFDIWKSTLRSDGTWSEAENLGDKVNTPKTEVFPSLTPDGQLLFASNGWAGLGGLDVFLSDRETKHPLNLLGGINSEKDDFGLYFTDRKGGFLSSNRSGSVGDDDIWSFTMDWNVETVRTYNAASGEVKIMARDAATRQGLPVQVTTTPGEPGGKPVVVNGDADGAKLVLTVGQDATINADGYHPLTVKVTDEMLKAGMYNADMDALPGYDNGPVSVSLRDKNSGNPLAGAYVQVHNRTMTYGKISTSGAPLQLNAGGKLQLEADGYEPVMVEVTKDLIKGARLDQGLQRSGGGGKAVGLNITDAANKAAIGAELSAVRAGVTTTRLISPAGTSLSLMSGDQLTVSSAGYGTSTMTVTKSDLMKPALSVALKPSASDGKSPSADQGKNNTAGAPNGGSSTQDGKTGQGDQLVQIRMLENQKFIIYFNFDKVTIRKDAAEVLAKVAYVLLEEYEAAQVLLTGHTDTRGSYAYNEQLSKNRVNTARKWLIDRGVDPKRIRTDHHGELKLALICADPAEREKNPDKCLTKEEHQLNRRVEIEILNIVGNN